MLLLALAVPVLAVDGQVVGLKVGDRWRPAVQAFARTHPRVAFRAFGLGTAESRTRTYGFETGDPGEWTFLATGRERPDRAPLLGGLAPRAPRPVTLLPSSAPYEAAARRALLAAGTRVGKARVTRVLRVDLDGDGTDETIVEAGSGGISRWASKGSYSLVLLRALHGGRVVETPLDLYPHRPGGAMLRTRTRGVADLDGDGRMEVLVTDEGVEETGAFLWGYRAGRATLLLENGNGV